MGYFDLTVILQTVDEVYLESGVELSSSWTELAIEKPAIWIEKTLRKERVRWVFELPFGSGMREETCLLWCFQPQSKICLLLVRFSEIAGFHPPAFGS